MAPAARGDPAHGTIRRRLTIESPSNCSSYLRGNHSAHLTRPGAMTVHWDSLLGSHVSFVDAFTERYVHVC